MADWNDIKKAFERDLDKQEEKFVANEQRLLNDVANYLSSQKGASAIQGYQPTEVLEFLNNPISEIKLAIGGEWSKFEDSDLETLAYSLAKKVKLSGNMIPW
ncbi:MAG: hypothetical protein IJ485_01205 [Lachnospiraceae bacterium]|nr:hypothetical protein [Lachnospiraceae bacterium]